MDITLEECQWIEEIYVLKATELDDETSEIYKTLLEALLENLDE